MRTRDCVRTALGARAGMRVHEPVHVRAYACERVHMRARARVRRAWSGVSGLPLIATHRALANVSVTSSGWSGASCGHTP
jgi:hypothetical protein